MDGLGDLERRANADQIVTLARRLMDLSFVRWTGETAQRRRDPVLGRRNRRPGVEEVT
jgi:hypothetical protein